MSQNAERPLTKRESERVARHLPLVYHQLRRQLAGCDWQTRQFGDDLVQEGCLALARAVREHERERHGPFGPYAVARIHNAMGMFLRERRHAVRVPVATQKRRAVRDRHAPDVPTPIEWMRWRKGGQAARHHPRRSVGPEQPEPAGPTIGELMRARIDAAIRAARDDVIGLARSRDGAARLVGTIVRERMAIPEPQAQTPVRELVRRLRVSHGRLVHTVARLARRAADRLRRDTAFRYLRIVARRAEGGTEAVATEEQRRMVERAMTGLRTVRL